jgi:dTDP-4-dehydrorhamnose reductase
MKVWVIGKHGLLGSALERLLGSDCVATSKEEASITDLNALFLFAKKHRGITHIINASAFSLVDLAENCREEAFLINALGPENIGHVAQEIGSSLIHISTDYVFAGDLKRPLLETDTPNPLNYYGYTKREGELRLLNVFPQACILRVSALFGIGGKNFVAKILQMLQEKEEIFLSNDQWNSPTFVEDLAFAILAILDRQGIYHFSNRGEASKFDFGMAICEYAKKRNIPILTKKCHPVPSSYFVSVCKRPVYSVFNTEKIEKILPTKIRSWKEALDSFLERIL